MPKRAPELKATQVAAIKQQGTYAVGGVSGLMLQVSSPTSRSWVLRATIDGKRREMGLGSFPEVGLAQARELARSARDAIREGLDPIADRQRKLQAQVAGRAAKLSFAECAQRYIASNQDGWKNTKHAQQWTQSLSQHVFPTIGSMAVEDVGLPQVLAVLEPLWRSKTETASRLRGRIEQVLGWATVRGYRSGENPARWRGHLDMLLPAASKVAVVAHHRALEIDQIGDFMQRLRAMPGLGARALEFTILTAARSGEARGARWSEINLDKAVWTLPAARMKAGKEQRVPLSPAALDLLRTLPREHGVDVVFPGTKRGVDGQPLLLSDMTLSAVIRRLGVQATVHGMRSTFRDWAGERTAHAREVIEHALAHQLKDKAEASYARGDLFDKRRVLMADWALFVGTVREPLPPSDPLG